MSKVTRSVKSLVLRFLYGHLRITLFLWIRALQVFNRLHQPLHKHEIKSGIRGTSGAGDGTKILCEAILPYISKGSNVLDIGSNSGYFTREIGKLGVNVLGIEPDPLLYKVSLAQEMLEPKSTVSFRNDVFDLDFNSTNQYDTVLCLSVFQQWAERFGFEDAKEILRKTFMVAHHQVFFSLPNTIQNRKILKWLPDMGKTLDESKLWIENLLREVSDGCQIEYIGIHPSDFRPDDYRQCFRIIKA